MHIKTDTILNSVMEKNDIVHFFNLFNFTIYLTSFFLLADLFLYFVLFLEMFRKLAVIPGKVVISRWKVCIGKTIRKYKNSLRTPTSATSVHALQRNAVSLVSEARPFLTVGSISMWKTLYRRIFIVFSFTFLSLLPIKIFRKVYEVLPGSHLSIYRLIEMM